MVHELTDMAQQVLEKRYIHTKLGESSWGDVISRIMQAVWTEAPEEVYEMLLERYFLPNSPTLVNAGTKIKGYSACYVLPFEDSLESIYQTKYNFAKICQKGGGCGTTLSNIRPKEMNVAGSTHSKAAGPLKFADTICKDMSVLSQGGFRDMAVMLTMSATHPDIEDFITAKSEEGLMSNANLSVMVTDDFMSLVEAGEDEWITEFGEHRVMYNPCKLFELIAEHAWKNGEPGLLFEDTINNSPYKYTDQYITATNPSLRVGTNIITDNGLLPIEELEGKKFKVRNLSGKWSSAECFLSGKQKELYKITFNGGVEQYCTKEHKWPVIHDGLATRTHTSELEIGDIIPVNLAEKVYGDLGSYSDGFLVGWIYGDGWITEREDNKTQQVGIIVSKQDAEHGIKDALDIKLSEIGVNTSWPLRKNRKSEWYEVNTVNNSLNNFLAGFGVQHKSEGLPTKIWNDCSKEFTLGFLDGMISSDGYVKEGRITITTAHEQLSKELQELLGSIGVHCNRNKRTSYNTFGKNQYYKAWNIVFSTRFIFDWALTHRKKNSSIRRQYKKSRSIWYRTVESVEKTKLQEDVWDIRVYDNTHCFALPNIITGNCGEQPLPPYGVCTLGSIDVSKFYTPKESIWWEESIDFEHLGEVVDLAVEFLDRVNNYSEWPIPEIASWVEKNNPIGLGVMGFADLLLKLGIKYGSSDSIAVAEVLSAFITGRATEKSIELGEKLGIPEECQKLPQPRRNITVTTVAPTGSLALIAGCSHGIEPIFSSSTYRKDNTGSYEIHHPLADQSHFKSAINDDPDKIVTWKEHVDIQASWQKFIDSGVSKTINLPNSATVEDIKNAFLYAWQSGCKGITVYRDGSRNVQVLNTSADFDLSPVTFIRPAVMESKTVRLRRGDENIYVTVGQSEGKPKEVFVNTASVLLHDVQIRDGISRLSSLALKYNVPTDVLIKELRQIPAQSIKSVPAAIALVLEMLEDVAQKCPDCGAEVTYGEGCLYCTCGWSKCG